MDEKLTRFQRTITSYVKGGEEKKGTESHCSIEKNSQHLFKQRANE